jgi:hypothetical protein
VPKNSARRVLPAALLSPLVVAACATTPNADIDAFARHSGRNSFEVTQRAASPEALVLPLVQDRQTEGPSCGIHALASVVNYWRGPGTLTGSVYYKAHPPTHNAGYSMEELLVIAREQGLLAQAVRMPSLALKDELERGRPVLVPVKVPSIYIQQRVLPGGDLPVIGAVRRFMIGNTAAASEGAKAMLIDHYLVVVGYDAEKFVVMEPVMGLRTINKEKLERYRAAFGDAAIVFSGPPAAARTS